MRLPLFVRRLISKREECWTCERKTPVVCEAIYPSPIAGFITGVRCPQCIKFRAVNPTDIRNRMIEITQLSPPEKALSSFLNIVETYYDSKGIKYGQPIHVYLGKDTYIQFSEWAKENLK